MRAVTPTNARLIFVYLLLGLLFMAAVGIAGAQPESPIPLPTHRSEAEARLVTVEQGDITLIERVLTVFKQSPLAYQTVDDMNVIVLYGPADAVKAAEEIIRQLDRPVHEESVVNVVFTVDILTNVKDLGGPIQDNAAAGVEAVRKDFPVQELFLMDRILMRAQDGSRVEGNGFIPLGGDQPSTYQFLLERAAIETTANGQMIRAYEMLVSAELYLPEPETRAPQPAPGQPAPPMPARPSSRRPEQNRFSVGLRSGSIVLQPGQPFVASKQNLMPGQALYFVVTARIEE